MTLARHWLFGLGLSGVALIVARASWTTGSADPVGAPRKRETSPSELHPHPAAVQPAPQIEREAPAEIQSRRDAVVEASRRRAPPRAQEVEPDASLPEPAPSPEPPPPMAPERRPPMEPTPELVGADEHARTGAPDTRQIELAPLRRWSQPGLCVDPSEGAAARETLRSRFRNLPWGDGAWLFIDPRLLDDAQAQLVSHLERAERQVKSDLGLDPERPEVFAYYDSKLLLAAACTNDDVVAYYDGALHVVLSHADVQDSVVHEYAHHALMSAGLLGPTWAQEGIAMHVARERWWQDPGWLTRVAARPLSLEAMEQAIPYTLGSEQAVLFYVQAASMVACAIRGDAAGVRGLFLELSAPPGASGAELSYDLPEALQPAALRGCIDTLMR